VGKFRHPSGKFPRRMSALRPRRSTPGDLSLGIREQDRRGSCLFLSERSVLRAAVLSIVLTLVIGPNTTLLCSVWCHPDGAHTSACQHQDATTSPRVTGEDSCRTVPARPSAFVREDTKRGSPTPISQQAVAVPLFRLGPPPTHAARAYDKTPSLDAPTSPLPIALRI
jgi:hypothetical protein